jgi:signal transduction histidine kinase
MKYKKRNNSSLTRDILVISTLGAILWTLVVGGSLYWNTSQVTRESRELARKEALTNLKKDLAFRLWGASHGGVYVSPDEQTPPNPYLAFMPDRDIITTTGKKLTLMNPAYMIRQIMEKYSDIYGVEGHITGLKVLNPTNVPDDWEKRALEAFDKGKKEYVELTDIKGAPFMRAMLPLVTEKPCLKCHAAQGYKVGDIRGGVSISVPFIPYNSIQQQTVTILKMTHGIFLILGLLFIFVLSKRMRYRIIERERAEKQLDQYAQVLQERNEELRSFTHLISHDLREPLLLIRAFSDRLRKKHGDTVPQKALEYVKRISRASDRMQDLLDGLLKYARVETSAGRFRTVNLADEIKGVLSDLEVRILSTNANIEVGELPVIEADPLQMRQLIQNLIGNSLKYHRPDVAPEIKIDSTLFQKDDTKKYCQITVQDNGIGFEKKYEKTIFDIFRQLHAHNQYEGAGVGLAICKKIVERHQGEITVRSEPGMGTTFTVELPLQQTSKR